MRRGRLKDGLVRLGDLTEVLAQVRYPGMRFEVHDDGRPYLQIVAADLGWRSRKWWLSFSMTRSELVQTALLAVLTAIEHEAREQFTYRGRPIFRPHWNVERLVELCDRGDEALDVRAPAPATEAAT